MINKIQTWLWCFFKGHNWMYRDYNLKWQYKIVTPMSSRITVEHLNELGELGWELISGEEKFYIFKRPKK